MPENGLSRLRGTGMNRLRGKGLEISEKLTQQNEALEPTPENIVGREVVQRDSGEVWLVTSMNPGAKAKELAHLESTTLPKRTYNKEIGEFLKDLNTPGSAWKLKE